MKKLIHLTFPVELTGEPITYNLIVNHRLRVNILRATIDYNIHGKLLIEIEGQEDKVLEAIEYLVAQGVMVTEYDASISIDNENCVSCGACTAVCEVGALNMDSDWQIQLDKNRCLGCKLCIKACPTRSISNVI